MENEKISQIFALAKRETRAALLRETKKMQKSSKKIWWFKKKVLSLHHFPLEKSGMLKKGS
ncbi:MAG: hypothetical protein II283_07650, partial [Alistipes sp.]|nr:hypothetical protein [Alistipes sp.]